MHWVQMQIQHCPQIVVGEPRLEDVRCREQGRTPLVASPVNLRLVVIVPRHVLREKGEGCDTVHPEKEREPERLGEKRRAKKVKESRKRKKRKREAETSRHPDEKRERDNVKKERHYRVKKSQRGRERE